MSIDWHIALLFFVGFILLMCVEEVKTFLIVAPIAAIVACGQWIAARLRHHNP